LCPPFITFTYHSASGNTIKQNIVRTKGFAFIFVWLKITNMLQSRLILLLLLISISGVAQEQWSLEKCVEYALENNLDVQQAAMNKRSTEVGVTQAKGQFAPSVNGNVYYGYNFGRRIDPFTNTFAQNTVATGNFNLSANWTIFSGLQILNNFVHSRYDYQSADYAYLNAQYLTGLGVTTSFLQILFNVETLKVAENQLEVTQQQVDRTRKLVDAGSAPQGSLYDIEAQAAREELAVVDADNQLVLSYLALKQLLRLPGDYSMEIVIPTQFDTTKLGLPTSLDAVIQTAFDSYPSIKSNEFALLSAEKQVNLSNGSLMPTLSLGGGVGSGYSGLNTDQSGEVKSFGNQVSDNFNQNLGLSLSIPIFNKLNTRAAINRAKVNVEIANNNLEREKQKVRQDIESAYADATAAYKRYTSTQKSLTSLQEAFDYAQKRFDVGMINAVDYNVAKTNLAKAQSDLVRAKYEYIFRMKILDFYQGIPITL
jgi:outer membrane protein